MRDTSRLGTAADREAEARMVELIERLELRDTRTVELEQEVEALRVQRDVLQAELDYATDVVGELTRQLIDVEAKLEHQPLSLAAHIRRQRGD